MKIFRTSDFIMAAAWIAAFILSLPVIHPLALSRLGAIACMAVFGAIVNANATIGPDGAPHGPQLATATHLVFLAIALVAVVLFAAVLLMPTRRASAVGTSTAATETAAAQ